MQDKELEYKWEQILHNKSQELRNLLIKHHSKRLQEIERDRKTLDQKMNVVWDQEDSLSSRKEQLTRSMRKLERDRKQQQNIAND